MSPSTSKRSLVTGGAGFIGSHVVDALVERGDQVAVIDDLSTGRRENLTDALAAGTTLHELDLRDRDGVQALVASFEPDAIYHLAAQADVRKAVADPDWDAGVNVIGTINLLEAARAVGSPNVVFAATGGAVYGEGAGKELPFDESATAAPETPYGASKLAGEVYIGLYRRLHSLPGIALRFANVYGPRQNPHGEAGVVAIFCGRVLDGEAPTIFGDGRQTRDFVFVGDVVEAMMAADSALEQRGTSLEGPINIGTAVEASVLDLLEILSSAAGREIEPIHEEERKGEVARISIDPGLASRELGWKPRTDLERGLALTLESVRVDRGTGPGVPAASRTVEVTSADEFSEALGRHLDCSGELELVGATLPGATALQCADCGTRIVHRGETLDPALLEIPAGAGRAELLPEGFDERFAVEGEGSSLEDAGQGRASLGSGPKVGREAAPTEEGSTDASASSERPRQDGLPREDGEGRSWRRQAAPTAAEQAGPLARLRNGFDRRDVRPLAYGLATAVVVALIVVVALLLMGGDSEPTAPPASAPEKPASAREKFGPISAELPPDWSESKGRPVASGAVELESEDGEATVLVLLDEETTDPEALAADAADLLPDLAAEVEVDRPRIGTNVTRVTGAYPDGSLEAITRANQDVGVISVADVSSAASSEVATEAGELARSVRLGPQA